MGNMIKNPVIPGFYPDPSICRVGDDFYLATSSFEVYPGIPIFHSKDLAHWELISHAMTMANGFHVKGDMHCGGVMAPTIRYHDGLFYVMNCNFADKGNYYVTAEDARGPWSEIHWITDCPDIDCSFFFDEDGKSYLVAPGNDDTEDNGRAIFLTPYDLKENKATGERVKIWNSGLRRATAPEAPHIYHIGNYYYLIIAEGGTEHYHAVCMARSKTVDGFYEGNPANPVLTHRHMGFTYPIDNVGHADLIDTPDGNWYAVFLASRIVDGQHKNLGRETYLCPVRFERDWAYFSPDTGKVEWEYPADPSLPWTPYPPELEKDDFDGETLDPVWCFWGTPYQDFWKLKDSALSLQCLKRPIARPLHGFRAGEPDLSQDDCVSVVYRRQRFINYEATLQMLFRPQRDEAAGLLVMQASNHQFRVEARLSDGKEVLRLTQVTTKQEGLPFLPTYHAETTEQELAEVEVDLSKPVVLRLAVKGQDYSFFYGESEDALKELKTHVDGSVINPEEVGGMVGTMIGMFATGNGADSENTAVFDWFELKGED